jgi:methylthioribulose-1-phosphate dehydratase
MLGTSGNLSAVAAREPLRLAITASGVDKGSLDRGDIVEVDSNGDVIAGAGRPSAETLLHLEVVRTTGAGAVLHTHSIWGTLLSARHLADRGLAIKGYEMLKGLSGVPTHDHTEWLPILENYQDYEALCRSISKTISEQPESHGFLLGGHGLYTWGADLNEARRHTEILEFLLEVVGRAEGNTT